MHAARLPTLPPSLLIGGQHAISTADGHQPEPGIAQRATVGGPLAEWHVLEVLLLDGRMRAAGWPAKPIPYASDRSHGAMAGWVCTTRTVTQTVVRADHTHNGDHVQQVIESTH